MAGHRGGRPAANGEESTHLASLGLQQRVLERPAGEGLRQVSRNADRKTYIFIFCRESGSSKRDISEL